MTKNSFHPGIFLQELLLWQKVDPSELAKSTGIPEAKIVGITAQRQRIDEEVSRGLAAYFGNSARFWQHLQKSFDRKSG